MGCFFSTTSPNVPEPLETAKVITFSGSLTEYSSPIQSSLILPNPCSFVCDSDDLNYDKPIIPLKPDDSILPGHVYFLLPTEKLKLALTGPDFAEMAGIAMSALEGASVTVWKDKNAKVVPTVERDGGYGERVIADRETSFVTRSNLGSIPEDQEEEED